MNSITTFLITLIFTIGFSHALAQTPTPPGTIVLDKECATPIQGGSAKMEDVGLFSHRLRSLSTHK